jgi:hypothetical protein
MLGFVLLAMVGLVQGDVSGQSHGTRAREGARGHMGIEQLEVQDLRLLQGGGPSHVLRQEVVGGSITSGQLTSTDLSDGGSLARTSGPQLLQSTGSTPRGTQLIPTTQSAYTIDPAATDLAWATDLGLSTVTFSIAAGSFTNGQTLSLRITDATATALEWDATDFEATAGVPLPTQTTGGDATDLYVFRYNSTSGKWGCIASSEVVVLFGTLQLHPNNAQVPDGSGMGTDGEDPALPDNSLSVARLRFDDTAVECAYWQFLVPTDYVGSLQLTYVYSAVSATTGRMGLNVYVWVDPGNASVYTHAYDTTANQCYDSTDVPATLGQSKTVSCTLTELDAGFAAQKLVKLKVCRHVAIGSNATGDMAMHNAILTYQR